ncbi:MAG: adenylate/guanylate cyclase domain-containing protein [Microcoleus sp.]
MRALKQLNRFSIRTKLIVMLLAVSLSSILASTFICSNAGQQILEQRVYNQLTSLRGITATQVEEYFKFLVAHTQTLSDDVMFLNAMKEYKQAFDELATVNIPQAYNDKIDRFYRTEFVPRLKKTVDAEPLPETFIPKTNAARYLQYHYLVNNPYPIGAKYKLEDPKDGSNYSRVNTRYNSKFSNIAERFGYYDMYLLDLQGNVVYLLSNEGDIGTNLLLGPVADSNLVQAFKDCRRSNSTAYVKIVDFQQYIYSYNQPSAFVASPIFDGPQMIGVLAFQIPADRVSRIVNGHNKWKENGLGETGETYLVGSDGLMRSRSRFSIEDEQKFTYSLSKNGIPESTIKKIRELETTILFLPVDVDGVKQALLGKSVTQRNKDYQGKDVLGAYQPVEVDGLRWAIAAEMDTSEAFAPISTFQRQVVIGATLIVVIVTLVAMWLARLFVKPLDRLIDSTQKLDSGDGKRMVESGTRDEFNDLAKSINDKVYTLRGQIQQVEQHNAENQDLIDLLLPGKIAKRIKQGEGVIADPVSNVSILFTDLHRFSKLFDSLGGEEVVFLLDELVDAFDDLADKYGLEKIKTIGDGYMAVCGLSVSRLDSDKRSIDCALEMLGHVRRFNYERGLNLDLRIGINTGDLISGIVGKSRYVYDVWGETVNIAHRLKTFCPPGNILVSEYVRDRLSDLYEFEPFEIIEESDKTSFPAWKLRNHIPSSTEQSEQPKNFQEAKKTTTVNSNSAGSGTIATLKTSSEMAATPPNDGANRSAFNRDERSN